MSIVSVTERFQERTGTNNQQGKTFVRVYRVDTDAYTDGALEVMSAPGIPQPYSEYENDPNYWVESADPNVVQEDPVTWNVTVKYVVKPPIEEGETGDKPWQKTPDISFSFVSRSRVLDKCYAVDEDIPSPPVARGFPEKKITNSNEQPFDPPIQDDDDYLLVIHIERDVAAYASISTDVEQYQNTINDDVENIAGITFTAFQCYCKSYRLGPKKFTDQLEKYYTENIEIVVDREGWTKKIVDAGLFTSTVPTGGAPRELTPILDENGDPITEPVMLDGAGQRLGAGLDPVLIDCHVKWEEDWGGWLPTDMT